MTEPNDIPPVGETIETVDHLAVFEAPFLRAPERVRNIFVVILLAASAPLLAGAVLFGWRAVSVSVLAIASATIIERLFYRVRGTAALLGRSHGVLTGLLVALTLPASVPWYVPVLASAFAILLGKAVFGGVGHFLWTPALVGRLAVAVLFPTLLAQPLPDYPNAGAVLARSRLFIGDIRNARIAETDRSWAHTSRSSTSTPCCRYSSRRCCRNHPCCRCPMRPALTSSSQVAASWISGVMRRPICSGFQRRGRGEPG